MRGRLPLGGRPFHPASSSGRLQFPHSRGPVAPSSFTGRRIRIAQSEEGQRNKCRCRVRPSRQTATRTRRSRCVHPGRHREPRLRGDTRGTRPIDAGWQDLCERPHRRPPRGRNPRTDPAEVTLGGGAALCHPAWRRIVDGETHAGGSSQSGTPFTLYP